MKNRTVIARNEAISELCQSRNGHIVLNKMPFLFAFVFCLFLSINALGQSKSDSIKHIKEGVVYVVDGIPTSKEQINTTDILIRQSITGQKLEESGFYPEKMLDSIVVIVTKQGAIKSYQKKFSVFSIKYKEYLESHPDEKNYAYIVDGTQIDYQTSDGIKKLTSFL